MVDISFNIACKELKIAQIAQLNQPFQLLLLIYIYGHGFYELSRMIMRKKVNNDVSKDSPVRSITQNLYKNTSLQKLNYLSLLRTDKYRTSS